MRGGSRLASARPSAAATGIITVSGKDGRQAPSRLPRICSALYYSLVNDRRFLLLIVGLSALSMVLLCLVLFGP
jgi:hypothetical protein